MYFARLSFVNTQQGTIPDGILGAEVVLIIIVKIWDGM